MENDEVVATENKEGEQGDNVGLSLTTRRLVYRGEKYRKILGFSAYEGKDLPFKYFDDLPVCFKRKGALVVIFYDESSVELHVGDLISQNSYHQIERNMRFCGHKLHLINELIVPIRKEWFGNEKLVI
ncbi:MAG: hypothetical protein WC389_12825 [Lutibacter sp.]|jgi:hypothetical protein